MKECKNSTKYLSKYFFDDISGEEKEKIKEHIEQCEYCLSHYKSYEKTLRIMDLRERKEPEKVFWNKYWANLAEKYPALKEKKRVSFTDTIKSIFTFEYPVFSSPALIRTASAVSLIVIGIFIGRYFFTSDKSPVPGEIVSVTPASPIVQKANDYLETSKVILVNILNLNGESTGRDFSLEKQASGKLVEDAQFIKANLGNSSRERRLRELVEDLEVILIELANLSDEKNVETVKFISEGIERREILFKIRLYEMSKNNDKKITM